MRLIITDLDKLPLLIDGPHKLIQPTAGISRCVYGSVSPTVKTVMDRAISYIHPDFVIRNGEMHHKRRYDNKITVYAYFYGKDINEREKATAKRLMAANVINYDSELGGVQFFGSPKEMEGVML